jgi:glycosyltransferase involved in cell wall biosynthesis
MSQEIAKRCMLELVVLPGREDGRGPSPLAMGWFGIINALRSPFRPRVDVVHLGDVAIWPLGLLELLFGRADSLVIAAHGSDISLATRSGWTAKLYKLYLKVGALLLPRARVVANSSYIAGLAGSVGFRNLAVVPLGTDLVAPQTTTRWGLLFAGRISRDKGLRFLMAEVLPLLPPTTRIRIAGPVWEKSERPMIEHPQAEYLGNLPPEKLAAEYAKAAITLVPSQVDEGFGLVAIEAAACGCQVIASNGGGLREAVRAPWGDLVNPDSAEEWATAIGRRLALPAVDLERISEAAKKDIDRHFRWSTAADRTMAYYCRLPGPN